MVVTVFKNDEDVPLSPFAMYQDVKNLYINKDEGVCKFDIDGEKIGFRILQFYRVFDLKKNELCPEIRIVTRSK